MPIERLDDARKESSGKLMSPTQRQRPESEGNGSRKRSSHRISQGANGAHRQHQMPRSGRRASSERVARESGNPQLQSRSRNRNRASAASPGMTGDVHGNALSPGPHKQNFIARLVNQWFDRVMGAVKGGGLSASEEEYEAHRTSRDFIWNSIGQAAWAFVFPVVTMVSTRIVGVEQAGMISMAFVVGLLLMFIGNFGARTYQISDINEEHLFKDYQANRFVTCILMLLIGFVYCNIRAYPPEMFNISMGVVIYRMVDALADVYEGRLQQVDKLYLAGISQTLRSVVSLLVFCVVLFLTHAPVVACYAMAIAAAATFVLVTYPLTLMETPKSRGFSMGSFLKLFKFTAPLFVAMFLFNMIENMPKFMMEGVLPYDNQLYYNALYFPAQIIHISSQLVYKPLLLRMSEVWQNAAKRRRFDLILLGVVGIILAITAIVWAVMAWVGIPVMSFLYGEDFEPHRGLLYVMLVTGGVVALIDFLYQVITIMRRQKDVTAIYAVTFGFSLFVPFLLIQFAGLNGAVLSYLIVETILLVLLVWEYLRIRQNLVLPAEYEEIDEDEPIHRRPSEIRAEREYREEVLSRRLHR